MGRPRRESSGRKEPGDEFLIGVAGVGENNNGALQALHRMSVLDECCRHAPDAAVADAQRRQRAFVQQRMDLGDGNVQKLCDIGQGQPFAHKAFYITHGSRLP